MKKEYISYTKYFNNYNIVWMSKKEEVSTYEQDRVAQYILDNLEPVDGSEIKKIKFLRFEIPPTAAQTWDIDVEINDTITMLLSENKLGDELSYAYDPEELKIRKEKKRN